MFKRDELSSCRNCGYYRTLLMMEEGKRSKILLCKQSICKKSRTSHELMNKSICPLCGKPNDCYIENLKDPKDCWCNDVIIPKGIIALVPDEALHQACICKACILKFKESNESGEDDLTVTTN